MPNENLTPRENTAPTPTPTPAPQTQIVPPQTPVDTSMKMPAGAAGPEESKPPYLAIILGVLVLLLAVALGGLYLWGSMIMRDTAPTESPTASSTAEEVTPAVTEEPDSIERIEADLAGDDFQSIDAELEAIDAEIEGSATTTE